MIVIINYSSDDNDDENFTNSWLMNFVNNKVALFKFR